MSKRQLEEDQRQRQEWIKRNIRELEDRKEELKNIQSKIRSKLSEAQNAQQKAQLLAEAVREVEVKAPRVAFVDTEQNFQNAMGIEIASIEDSIQRLQSVPEEPQRDPAVRMFEDIEKVLQYIFERSQVRIRITEDPLTAQNLLTIISALTELHTKCWLIANRRFDDLIEYTQTHNIRFVEEANLVVTKLSHNSPTEMELRQGLSGDTKSKPDSSINVDVKVEASPQAVMQALGTAIDGVVQAPLRFREKQLEIQAKAQDLKQLEQKTVQESQMAALEREKQELENERRRLELVEKRLEVQKKGIEYALEIASKTVEVLYPTANEEAKAMITRTLLPTILQLDNVKGLELALPAPPSSGERTETKQNG